ncbi:Uncharacterised protein [uncultured archaeon]|nr:Uncharacterised protein [uncultured archaeon]
MASIRTKWVKLQLKAVREQASRLREERESLVKTYEQQLTLLEERRKQLAQECPHDNMLYGLYNQCADCGEWF